MTLTLNDVLTLNLKLEVLINNRESPCPVEFVVEAFTMPGQPIFSLYRSDRFRVCINKRAGTVELSTRPGEQLINNDYLKEMETLRDIIYTVPKY